MYIMKIGIVLKFFMGFWIGGLFVINIIIFISCSKNVFIGEKFL